MNEKYVKLINACLPDALIIALEGKSGLDRKSVENVCLEVVARVFGDGSDLSKATVISKLKKVVSGEEIKSVLERLENKYGIKSTDSSKVLEQLLPLLFKRITSLDDSYFVEEKFEEIKEEVEPETIVNSSEPTVEEVYKNIEKRAEAQETTKQEPKHIKTKKPLFKKKEKKVVEKEMVQDTVEDEELSLLEKICMIVVGVALLALIGIVIFLFIKQRI